MKKYGIAICGLGRAGFIHTKNCYENPNIFIKYFVDKQFEPAEKVKELWGLNDTKVVLAEDFSKVLGESHLSIFELMMLTAMLYKSR